MSYAEKKKLRLSVTLTILIVTAVFFALLWAGVHRVRAIPQERAAKIESLLEAGDTDEARRLIGLVDDEALAASYLARCAYLDAERLFADGNAAEARVFFSEAGSYADAEDRVKACDYALAEELADSGDLAGAAEAFAALGGFSDAAERSLACRYELADSYEKANKLAEAADLFEALGPYRDAADRLVSLARTVTGIVDDDEEAIAVMRGMSPEMREKMYRLARRRESLPGDIIAVGFYHTVGLRPDGTLAACGDNSAGQCGVSSLSHVTAVAAGAYHTLALLEDGTVAAVGRNSEHQCDTSSWRNVVKIAASDYASFGLTADGRILCTGFYDYRDPMGWSNITDVCGGSYNMAAVASDGSVLTFPKLKQTDALRGCVALTVNTGFVAAVMKDGSVVSNVFDLSGWDNAVAISSSGTAILALDLDGHVLSHFFRSGDDVGLGAYSDVVALAAGGTHYALVFSDGSVKVLGENNCGQADTESWQLAAGS